MKGLLPTLIIGQGKFPEDLRLFLKFLLVIFSPVRKIKMVMSAERHLNLKCLFASVRIEK